MRRRHDSRTRYSVFRSRAFRGRGVRFRSVACISLDHAFVDQAANGAVISTAHVVFISVVRVNIYMAQVTQKKTGAVIGLLPKSFSSIRVIKMSEYSRAVIFSADRTRFAFRSLRYFLVAVRNALSVQGKFHAVPPMPQPA